MVLCRIAAALLGIMVLGAGSAAGEAVRAADKTVKTVNDPGKTVMTAAAPEKAAVSSNLLKEAEEKTILPVLNGDEQPEVYLPLLKDKRVALFSNQTGIVEGYMDHTGSFPGTKDRKSAGSGSGKGRGQTDQTPSESRDDLIPFGENRGGSDAVYGDHILDVLVQQDVEVTAVFCPEHGFRGTADAGAGINDSVDEKTGIPILSLYGQGSACPSQADLDRFDVLVVDIQDVGLRYYTYYISMYCLMDACAAAGKEVVILDRPNPNGFYVDGPILQKEFRSGVGILPIPVVHGMTLGELARMINGEGWLSTGPDSCELAVVPCKNYIHSTLTALEVRPSPNLRDMRAVYLYASTCFFENTAFSVGRGTEHPFEIYGSPYLEETMFSDASFSDASFGKTSSEESENMDVEMGEIFSFTPVSMEGAASPPFEGQTCRGRDLRKIPLDRILKEKIDLRYVIEAFTLLRQNRPDISFFGTPDGAGHYWIDYLCGTDQVRHMIEDGKGAEEIEKSWQEEVEDFKKQREPYLLYEE